MHLYCTAQYLLKDNERVQRKRCLFMCLYFKGIWNMLSTRSWITHWGFIVILGAVRFAASRNVVAQHTDWWSVCSAQQTCWPTLAGWYENLTLNYVQISVIPHNKEGYTRKEDSAQIFRSIIQRLRGEVSLWCKTVFLKAYSKQSIFIYLLYFCWKRKASAIVSWY